MLELRAEGHESGQRRQVMLQPGRRYVVGRGPDVDVVIDWDAAISRRHVEVQVVDQQLQVRRLTEGRNPVFSDGRIIEEARLSSGQSFVLGSTLFRIGTAQLDVVAATPLEERDFSAQQLKRIRYQDPENRLEVLTHLSEVIAGTQSDAELYERLAQLLLRGVVHAEAVAIVSEQGETVVTRHWERRRQTAGEVRPSRRLVTEALSRRRSVLHVWNAAEQVATEPTLGQEFDWAYCTPVPGLAEEPAGLYVAGRMGQTFIPGTTLSEQSLLEADVKFTDLVAEIIGSFLTARRLERQKAGLRQFFAPPVLSALGADLDTTLLEPRECDVTVLFCDLRGFSQRAENEAHDLIGLLERVSRALGVMTQQILAHGGVTGDFQGDAALGFWGWPLASTDAPLQACRAALGIRQAFQRAAAQKDHPLRDFSMGIGLAHGRAVAGKIGTAEQVKVTVFGPVVNLAHRLESMTKMLRASILMDEAAAAIVRERMSPEEGRLRRLARVLPYGLETPVFVHELVPPANELPDLTDTHLADFEQGVDHFTAGRWDEAYHRLRNMPASDRVQDFLIQQILLTGRVAPPGWDGIVRLPAK